MKTIKIKFNLLLTVLIAFLLTGTAIANNPVENNQLLATVHVGAVSFKLSNDTGGDFSFYANGKIETISDGQTKSYSFDSGVKIYHVDGGKQGVIWFEVTTSMNGKKFNVSDL